MTVVCIAGMHRSGTSMVTKALNAAGVYLGPENDVFAVGSDNLEGYWENRNFVKINDLILGYLNAGWDFPPKTQPNWRAEEFEDIREQAYQLIATFNAHKTWGWKDPRNSLTLPFWKELLPSMKVVVCLRNPQEVATSLTKRNNFSHALGFNLWLEYNQRILSFIEPENRLITHYDAYFQDPLLEVRRILNFLELDVSEKHLQNSIHSVSIPLRHNKSNLLDLMSEAPLEVVNLYQKMSEQPDDVIQASPRISLRSQISFNGHTQDDGLTEKNVKMLSRELIKEKRHNAENEQTINLLLTQLAEKKQELNQVNQQRDLFHDALNAIVNSKAWKLILLLQKIYQWLLPTNSFQAKTFQYIQKNGVKETLLTILYRAKRERPQTKLDISSQVPLQNILNLLRIPLNSEQLLTVLIDTFGKRETSRIIANIVDIEKFILAPKTTHSIIRASQLPPPSSKPHRRNILFITAEFPNHHHGGGNRVLNFIRTLSVNNNIYVCSAFLPKEHEHLLPSLGIYCQDILKIPYGRFGGNQDEIRRWLAGTDIDIVHYEWPRSLENYDLSFGSIQIFTYMESVSLRLLMDMERLKPLSAPWNDKLKQLIDALALEFVQASKTNARIAVTEKDAKFFESLYPYQEYTILNHGLDFENFVFPDIKAEPNTLVFVGNYLHYPNAEAMDFFFNEIWQNIREEIADARIYIVGTNPPENLERMSDGKNIIVTGTVADVRPYIQKASVCIAPLISGAGLRGKLIEYAALRRPFVATSIASAGLVFKDGLDYYCADTALEFSSKIITLLKDPQLSRKMGETAYVTAENNYDNKRLTGFLLSFYEYLENRLNAK